MLSIHYVSIMMRIFYIVWQQHWECDRTMNIGANAHGERTVSTKQPQVTDLTSVDSWASSDTRKVLSYFSSHLTVSQSDYITVRPFYFASTYVFVVWNFTRLLTRLKSFVVVFLTSIWWRSTQLQCIYYLHRILISRPPRVFRRFKRRSCLFLMCLV